MNVGNSTRLLLFLAALGAASAQNFSGDARKIGMGAIGSSENIATKMIDEQRPYRSIVLPLGFIQAYQDRDRFDPNDDRFDPILAVEYAANPIHYVIGRSQSGPGNRFGQDIRNAQFNRDLNAYRGFVPTNTLTAEGLASPTWGKTIKFINRSNGTFHGFFLGVGPYISAKTRWNIDQALTAVLSSPTPVSIPNRSFSIADGTVGQLALSGTGGYRGRIAFPSRPGASAEANRDGIYIGANYHYLRGFRYEAVDMLIRMDTDAAGLLTIRPATTPAVVDYFNSRSGTGFALDFGVAGVIGGWEFGFGANGIANRIEWQNVTGKRFRLASLVEGGSFIESSLGVVNPTLRVELPVDYTGSGAYHTANWSVVTEASHGFQGNNFRGGIERRFGRIEFRGGGRYGLNRWHPTGGVGLNLSDKFSVDVGAFGTTTNVERLMRPGVAVSLRFNAANN